MSNIVTLKSVFYKRVGKYWEHKLYWENLTDSGKQLLVEFELDGFINEDFATDRFYLSCFLDLHQLWDSFDVALGNIELISNSNDKQEALTVLDDWLTNDTSFNIAALYSMLSNLKLLATFETYMFNQRWEYHQECCDCGYPLIVPNEMKSKLLKHISWNI